MENKLSEQDVAQQHLEKKDQNFFFEHVKERVAKLHEDRELCICLENIISKINIPHIVPFNKNEYEVLGILSFIVGMDYCGQAYYNKQVIENVSKRFKELSITEEEYYMFVRCMILLKDSNIEDYIEDVKEDMKNKIIKKLSCKDEEKLLFKNLKLKLNGFLDVALIPIGFAVGLSELRKEELTYENVLKINSLLNENATFSGTDIEKLTLCYSDPLFNKILKKSLDVLNESKYAILFEESIISAIEAINRLGALIINPEFFTDSEYKAFAESWKEKIKPSPTVNDDDVTDEDNTFDTMYTQEDVQSMMIEHPDEFILTSLKDIGKKKITDIKSIVDFIGELTKNDDYMQHLYMYMGQNLKSPKRIVGVSYLPEDIDNVMLVNCLNEIITMDGAEYKKLAEINCAEIPEDQINRVVTYVNDCIKSCQLRTNDQKQYLVSQVIENQITTWNHLQQLLSIIETCEIKGKDCLTYVNLNNYINDKSNIVEVFENGEKMNKLQIRMSVYRSFREWFKFHLPIETDPQTSDAE